MNSRIIDLTGDSSDFEPAKAPVASMPRAKRQPLKAVRNGVRREAQAASPPKPVISAALEKAIDTLDAAELRGWVKYYCKTVEPMRSTLEEKYLVLGKDVVRYHADTDSEDDKESENESSEEEEDDEEDDTNAESENEPRKKLKPIAAADDEMVPRYAECLNCKERFDVSDNKRGYCRWHTGMCNQSQRC